MATRIVSPLNLRLLAAAFCVALVLVLSGCDDRDDKAPVASFTAPRPDVLSLAASEIKAGKGADAQKRLDAFLEQERESAYRPEAMYLLGQALAAQGQYKEAKEQLDTAVDKAEDRNLKALAMLGRADCNMALQKFHLASRQYHWIETMYRDVKAIPQDELMYKLGLATKQAGFPETADYWFRQVIELYATGPFVELAKAQHTKFAPAAPDAKPLVYTLEVSSFAKKEDAEAEAAALRAKEYRDVQVIATTINSNPIYEVHIGKFVNKSDALRAQTDAELAGLGATIRPRTIEPLR
jgi:TolA-binding protein